MSHDHAHSAPQNLTSLIWAIGINIGIVAFEVFFGIISGSLSLITDAVHNLTDISSMVLGYFSEKISLYPTNNKKTYGYKKAEFLSAFVNALILFAAVGYILYEAALRIFHPSEVLSAQMFVVGVVAVVGNSLATWILTGGSKDNMNMKAVWLHSLQDALLSVGVIIGAVAIYFTGWNIIDPLISIFIALFIIKSTYALLKQTVDSLLDSVPENIDFDELKNSLQKIDKIKKVNDLHIWANSSKEPILTAHLQVSDEKYLTEVFVKAKKILHDKYGIEHATLQVMPKNINKKADLECNHCN